MRQEYQCGAPSDCGPGEEYKIEISCILVGCRNCKNFNGTEYHEADIREAMRMFAKHELEQMKGSLK